MTATTKPVLSLGEPSITIEKTEALRAGWVTSGRVVYPVDGGRSANVVLEFSFKDAASRSDAIQQSLNEIEALIDALSATVSRLQAGNSDATPREWTEAAAA
jgi:hypothetical protein